MACDLHVHSNASDGGFTPAEVIRHAHGIGLTCISLTDHDTFDGIEEAWMTARELGMPFIPGIEMTAVFHEQEIHILGYFLDYRDPGILEALEKSHACADKRLDQITKNLTAQGLPVTMDEVRSEAGSGSKGRPHVARVMVRKGYVQTHQEAFDRYLGNYGSAYVPPKGFSPEEIYKLIRDAGGIPSIAHPGLLGRADMMKDDDIALHKEYGAMAIEIFHPRHDDFLVSYYMNLARKMDMGISGGSDCHGSYYPVILMERKAVPDWVSEKFIEFYKLKTGKDWQD